MTAGTPRGFRLDGADGIQAKMAVNSEQESWFRQCGRFPRPTAVSGEIDAVKANAHHSMGTTVAQ